VTIRNLRREILGYSAPPVDSNSDKSSPHHF
jgi:hypothetical protein